LSTTPCSLNVLGGAVAEVIGPRKTHAAVGTVFRGPINPPTPLNHWKVYALLSGCHEGRGIFQIYSAPLNKAPGRIKWTPPQRIPDVQKPGYAPDMRWYVVVRLYDETSGGDEAVAMARSCRAFGSDRLVGGTSNKPVVRIEP